MLSSIIVTTLTTWNRIYFCFRDVTKPVTYMVFCFTYSLPSRRWLCAIVCNLCVMVGDAHTVMSLYIMSRRPPQSAPAWGGFAWRFCLLQLSVYWPVSRGSNRYVKLFFLFIAFMKKKLDIRDPVIKLRRHGSYCFEYQKNLQIDLKLGR